MGNCGDLFCKSRNVGVLSLHSPGQQNCLNPSLFLKEPVVLSPCTALGKGIEIRFADGARLVCQASTELLPDPFGNPVQAIVLRCDNRQPGEWVGLEIDVTGRVDRVELGLRYCPAERLFPRVYYLNRGKTLYFDEPDRAAPERVGIMEFNVRKWRLDLATAGIIPERLWFAIQLPERPWFVAALTGIRRR